MVNTIRSTSIQPLDMQDLLPPMSRWSSLSGLVLVGTIGVAISLASIVRYNVIVKSNATIRPAGELRVVQAEIEGSIKQLTVKDHQQVRQGDPIAYLDDTRLQIQKSQLQGNLQQNQTQIDQVAAQIRFLEAQMAAESSSTDRSIAAAQAQTIRNQREYLQQSTTAQAEVQEARVALEQAQDEYDRYLQLAQSGAVSELQLKEKESAVRTAAARLERTQASLNPTDASVMIAQAGVAQELARGKATLANLQKERESLIQRQAEIQAQVIRDQKELQQVERDLQRSVIRATSDGTVFQLTLQNSNQVVRSGDTIAQIVPTHTPLVVRANVANQDIDRVQVGQVAQVRVDACPYSDYGVLEGKVQTIAPDTGTSQSNTASSTPQATAASGTFAVTIAVPSAAFGRGQQQCRLQSGMQASANIISKQETFLQFVLRKARLWTDL